MSSAPPPSRAGTHAARLALPRLGPADAAVFETFVVPRYLSFFGELALDLLVEGADAQVIHVDCRTGYPDRGLALKLAGAHVYGCDPSMHCIELARAKAQTMPGMVADYRVADRFPLGFTAGAFSHALTLHPVAAPDERRAVVAEIARLLAPAGQALVAMPLRGSFQELVDLLREYALKHDAVDFGKAIETAYLLRPTAELLGAELEEAGFHFVDVVQRPTSLPFKNGREFLEDPVTRLVVVPDLKASLGDVDLEAPLAYVRDAIDRYWSDAPFELTVVPGCATGRRV